MVAVVSRPCNISDQNVRFGRQYEHGNYIQTESTVTFCFILLINTVSFSVRPLFTLFGRLIKSHPHNCNISRGCRVMVSIGSMTDVKAVGNILLLKYGTSEFWYTNKIEFNETFTAIDICPFFSCHGFFRFFSTVCERHT